MCVMAGPGALSLAFCKMGSKGRSPRASPSRSSVACRVRAANSPARRSRGSWSVARSKRPGWPCASPLRAGDTADDNPWLRRAAFPAHPSRVRLRAVPWRRGAPAWDAAPAPASAGGQASAVPAARLLSAVAGVNRLAAVLVDALQPGGAREGQALLASQSITSFLSAKPWAAIAAIHRPDRAPFAFSGPARNSRSSSRSSLAMAYRLPRTSAACAPCSRDRLSEAFLQMALFGQDGKNENGNCEQRRHDCEPNVVRELGQAEKHERSPPCKSGCGGTRKAPPVTRRPARRSGKMVVPARCSVRKPQAIRPKPATPSP